MIRISSRDAGHTLIEMLIVVLIMGFVTAQMFVAFTVQKRVFLVNDRALEIQESARLLSDVIAHDARLAGFMVPDAAGASSVDGGANDADRLCLSESNYFPTPLDGTPEVTMDNRGDVFAGAGVVALGGTNLTLALSDLDVNGDGTSPDFTVGAGVVLSNGVNTFCAGIQQIAGGNLTLAHTVPGGLFPVPSSVVAVPAILYELDAANLILRRDGVVLSDRVEDLQVEFWVDAENPDGVVDANEFPVHDLNNPPGAYAMDLTRIRRIQISVLTRSDRGDQQEGVLLNRYRRPAVANRVAGARDDLARRRFTVSVLPRNLI